MGVVTLFVNNLPLLLHWSGLRQVFGRFGDVVESFIAKRQNQNGKKNSAYDLSKDSRKQVKRIVGHVVEESLWKLSKCLIGLMSSECNTKNVKDMLYNWGLGELEVKSLGRKRILIFIKDDDLLKTLETNHWSLLKEVFMDVEYWSDSFKIPERTTWIEVAGIPLHYRNPTTFRRIVATWGSLEALGENETLSKVEMEKAKVSAADLEESSSDSSEVGINLYRYWEENRLLGEAELVGCLSEEVVGSVSPKDDNSDFPIGLSQNLNNTKWADIVSKGMVAECVKRDRVVKRALKNGKDLFSSELEEVGEEYFFEVVVWSVDSHLLVSTYWKEIEYLFGIKGDSKCRMWIVLRAGISKLENRVLRVCLCFVLRLCGFLELFPELCWLVVAEVGS
ncbi:hypothetical protein V6N13_015126 [Hibiscus sabdariffa]